MNILGSLFYGSLLGVFILAFFFKRVGGTAAFLGMLAGEAAILCAFAFTKISFLWYNVVGCLVVVGTGVLLTAVGDRKTEARMCNYSACRSAWCSRDWMYVW